MALCEAVAYYKTKGMSLWDKMTEMYERYGYWLDGVQAITLKGKEGIEKIQNTIEKLRQQVPTESMVTKFFQQEITSLTRLRIWKQVVT